MNDPQNPFRINWKDIKLEHAMMFLYKTRRCPFLTKNNHCDSGDNCFDSHKDIHRRRPDANNYQKEWNYSHTKQCIFTYQTMYNWTKQCYFGKNCRDYHSTEELNFHPLNYKTRPCNDFQFKTKGVCSRGIMCWEYHNDNERRDIRYCFIPCDMFGSQVSYKMPPPVQFQNYLQYLKQKSQSQQQPQQQQQPPQHDVSDNDSGHSTDGWFPEVSSFLDNVLREPTDSVSNHDIKKSDDLNDIKETIGKMLEQMAEQDKKLNKILQQMKSMDKTKNNNREINRVNAIDLKTNKNEILIYGYLRPFYTEHDTYVNAETCKIVEYFYPEMNDIELADALISKDNESKHILDNDNIWKSYLMIKNVCIDVKGYAEIKQYIVSFLRNIGVEYNHNEIEIRYDENKPYIYVQLKMVNEDSVKSAISKAQQYVSHATKYIEKKWQVDQWKNRQWKNKQNKKSSKKHKEKAMKNKTHQNNKPQNQNQNTNMSAVLPNQTTSISGVLPLNYNYNFPVIPGSYLNYGTNNATASYTSPAYTFPLPNTIQPLYYNNNQQ